MKLHFKQKAFRLKEDIKIFDENEQVIYKIQGTYLEIPKRFKILDSADQELANIETYYKGIRQYFKVKTLDGEYNIKMNFNPFLRKFWVLENKWILKGGFDNTDFELYNGSDLIMYLVKRFPSIGDRYELNIINESNVLLCVVLAIVADRTR